MRGWKDRESDEWKEETNWTDVVLWRQENLGQYLQKGKQVYVEGRLQTQSYDDKDGKKVYATEVIAEDVILLGSGKEGAGAARTNGPGATKTPTTSAAGSRKAPEAVPGGGDPFRWYGHYRRRYPVLESDLIFRDRYVLRNLASFPQHSPQDGHGRIVPFAEIQFLDSPGGNDQGAAKLTVRGF